MAKQHQYPECEKLAAARPDMLKMADLLEWLEQKGLHICEFDTTAYGGLGDYSRTTQSADKILHQYFEIDDKKLEEERRAILDHAREANREKSE